MIESKFYEAVLSELEKEEEKKSGENGFKTV